MGLRSWRKERTERNESGQPRDALKASQSSQLPNQTGSTVCRTNRCEPTSTEGCQSDRLEIQSDPSNPADPKSELFFFFPFGLFFLSFLLFFTFFFSLLSTNRTEGTIELNCMKQERRDLRRRENNGIHFVRGAPRAEGDGILQRYNPPPVSLMSESWKSLSLG